MLSELTLDGFLAVARVGGLGGVFAWTLVWLLRRGDDLQRENTDELRRQRDDWRTRAEQAEAANVRHAADLEQSRSERQTERHALKSDLAGARMEAELWRRRAIERGWIDPGT